MKKPVILFLLLLLILIGFTDCSQVVNKAGKATRVLPYLLALVDKLIGLAAIIGVGLLAREHKDILPFARWTAVIGGIWCFGAWFGWPLLIESLSENSASKHIRIPDHPVLKTIGLILFGGLGALLFQRIITENREPETEKAD